ncbi:MAG: ATP-dependent DNA ligase [Myxococcota bacterium]|jgi:ATP-dependent DNA ligase
MSDPSLSPLPLDWPIKPMLAKRAEKLPRGDTWYYEPKWDGFRALVFKNGDNIQIQSRDRKPFARYFPELLEPLRQQLPERCIVDGEIVIAARGRLQFESLLQRIHPAESRVNKLAGETPASYVIFDLLAEGDEDLSPSRFAERRARLEAAAGDLQPPLFLTPMTTDRDTAADWFERFEGAGLDGVMAKGVDGPYEPGKRSMIKIKHKRTLDAVVGGFRWHKKGPGELLGSLMLGLYDDKGRLNSIGVAASFTMARRKELAEELAPLRLESLEGHPWQAWADVEHRVPGARSRWNAGKTLDWQPLPADRVVEVSYDHMQGTRFRHTAHFIRWRHDKPAAECTYDQCDVVPPLELSEIFAGEAPGPHV